MDNSISADPEPEAKISSSNAKAKGNWITFPFILGTMACLSLVGGGWQANLIVYQIEEFNVKRIDAALISNVFNGATQLIPFLAAIIADSFLGNFFVITISSCVSLLGMVVLALTAAVESLRPKPCEIGPNNLCPTPSKFQFAILYGGLALACIGCGGSRFTLAAIGANQFDKSEERGTFFNWFFFTTYISNVISYTAIVYVQDNVSWSLGFAICVAANFIGVLIFLLGNYFYRHDKPQGSPFAALARVVVAAVKKKNTPLSSRIEDYYFDNDANPEESSLPLTNSFRFFNRAAMETEGDIKPDGSIAKSWRLCTVQQVKDFKAVIRILPIWSSSIFLTTPEAVQLSSVVLQALSMDRNLGKHFKIPAASVLVSPILSTSIFLTLIDRFLQPLLRKLMRKSPSPFQRIGVGHVLIVSSMTVAALVESRRLKIAHEKSGPVVPMSASWLFLQLILAGISEAFHVPGQVDLYYQEFPASLRSTATAMISLIIGISFYLSTALIDVIRRVTDWLPDDINLGRLDNIYWMLAVLGLLNFGYFLCCAKFYTCRDVEKVDVEASSTSYD